MIGLKGFTSRKSFCRSGSQTLFFGGREATTENKSAARRLQARHYAIIKLFMINSVKIKGLGKLKMA